MTNATASPVDAGNPSTDPAALTPEEALKALEQQILEDLNRDKDRNDLPGVAARYGLQVQVPFVEWMTNEVHDRTSTPADVLNTAVNGLVSMIDALASKHSDPIYAQQMIIGRIGQLTKTRNRQRLAVARKHIIMPGT